MVEQPGLFKPLNASWDTSYNQLLKPRPCPYCPVRLEAGRGMAAHIREDHPEHARDHKCTLCEEGFPTKQVLATHRWNAHGVSGGQSGPRPYRCDVHSCLQTFHSKTGLGNHRWQAHGIPGEKTRPATQAQIISRETGAVDALIEILSEYDLAGQRRLLVRLFALLDGEN